MAVSGRIGKTTDGIFARPHRHTVNQKVDHIVFARLVFVDANHLSIDFEPVESLFQVNLQLLLAGFCLRVVRSALIRYSVSLPGRKAWC